MRYGAFLYYVLAVCLIAFCVGSFVPVFFDHIFDSDQKQAKKRAETIIVQAAQWYIIHEGKPTRTMKTMDIKDALIPVYLNKWPAGFSLECEIDLNGTIKMGVEGY